MAIRTTAAAVRKLLGFADTDTTDVDSYTETANQLVTDACGEAEYTDEKLELIERWLSAHFYRVMNPAAASETADVVSEAKQFRLGMNLNVTMFGQQALVLDTAGGLARLSKQAQSGKGITAGIAWLGTEAT